MLRVKTYGLNPTRPQLNPTRPQNRKPYTQKTLRPSLNPKPLQTLLKKVRSQRSMGRTRLARLGFMGLGALSPTLDLPKQGTETINPKQTAAPNPNEGLGFRVGVQALGF